MLLILLFMFHVARLSSIPILSFVLICTSTIWTALNHETIVSRKNFNILTSKRETSNRPTVRPV